MQPINWRKKKTSHRLYNNCVRNDWDANRNGSTNHPDMQIMWLSYWEELLQNSKQFQVGLTQFQWCKVQGQNLAGGGEPMKESPMGQALVEGDIELYTEDWPADSE
jgi:hypothetical protein